MRIPRTLLGGASALTAAALTLLWAGPSAVAAPTGPDAPVAVSAPPRPMPGEAPSAARSFAVSPSADGSGPVCWYGACYDYVSGRQITDASGASVRMLQAAPAIKPGDTESHSLQELALQSADRKSTVEIGWTVDFGLNGDLRPHLFVYHWVNGEESCYNGCGFVPVSRTVKPGMPVRAGRSAEFKIENRHGDWWLYYDGHAVGYFPGALWQGGYTRAQVITAFGEVAHAKDSTCEQMGNGLAGTSRGASWMDDFRLVHSSDRPALTVTATSPALYDQGRVTRTSFRLGGPGNGHC
jgi:hypothetical protein